MNTTMTQQDIRKVIRAVETLDKMNQKYNKPHGDNPLGIAFLARTQERTRGGERS